MGVYKNYLLIALFSFGSILVSIYGGSIVDEKCEIADVEGIDVDVCYIANVDSTIITLKGDIWISSGGNSLESTALYYCSTWSNLNDRKECATGVVASLEESKRSGARLMSTVTTAPLQFSVQHHSSAERQFLLADFAARAAMRLDFSGACAPIQSLVEPSRVAVIVSGCLRFRNSAHFSKFQGRVAGSTVFIGTYQRYLNVAEMLTRNSSRIVIVDKIVKDLPYNHVPLFQWASLDAVLKKFRHELLSFDFIVRTRTDLMQTDLRYAELPPPRPGVVRCSADFVFYASPLTFISAFDPMLNRTLSFFMNRFDDAGEAMYVPLHWDNLVRSELSQVKWWW